MQDNDQQCTERAGCDPYSELFLQATERCLGRTTKNGDRHFFDSDYRVFPPGTQGGVRGRVQKGAWGVRESAGGCKGVQKVLERERQFFLFLMLQD